MKCNRFCFFLFFCFCFFFLNKQERNWLIWSILLVPTGTARLTICFLARFESVFGLLFFVIVFFVAMGLPGCPETRSTLSSKWLQQTICVRLFCNCCFPLCFTCCFVQEDQQIEETKAILSLTYQALSNKELVARCKQIDRDAALQRKQKWFVFEISLMFFCLF